MSHYDRNIEDRKKEEIEFHNAREIDRVSMSDDEFLKKYPNKNFYAIDRANKQYLNDWLLKNTAGKRVLDYCCGTGVQAVKMAKLGAHVYGIDISNNEIDSAVNRAKENRVENKTIFQVMDAEAMAFQDDFFDVVVCTGVLHHLDLDNAFPEIARVLKPGGSVICVEALGYNPFINLYRRLTPHLRTQWEVGHILTLREIKQGLKYFSSVDIRYYHLFTLLVIPFRKKTYFDKMLSIFEALDQVLLRIPLMQLLAWQVYFVYKK